MDKLVQAKLGPRSSDTAALHMLLSTLNLTDIYRQCHPDVPGYTWSRSNLPVACRLDMFLTSCALVNKVHEISVLPTAFSDHSCVLLKLLDSSTYTRGRGYWKLNKSRLSEACYRRKVTAFWLYWQYQKPRFLSLIEWRDAGKAHIKSLSIRYGIQCQRKRSKTRTRL